MKHILCLCLTALLCCLLYTGCKQQPASFVQSAQLSQNEQALLQLLEIEQPQLFDFSVEGAKSLSLELFTLENGSWKPAGSFSGNIDQPSCTGRILCRTDPDTHQISSLAVENLGSIQRIQPQMESLPAATGYGQSAISGRPDITLEQPVALCVLYLNRQQKDAYTHYLPDYALENPQEIESDAAQLVTLTFSAQPLA